MSDDNAPTPIDSITALPGQPSGNQGDKGGKKVVSAEPRNVHWGDMHGYELTHVREFEPSSDDEDSQLYNYDKKCCVIA